MGYGHVSDGERHRESCRNTGRDDTVTTQTTTQNSLSRCVVRWQAGLSVKSLQPGGTVLDGKRRYEVAFTVLMAVFLIGAAEGRHAFGFYVVLRLAATVGAVYWAVRVYRVGPRGWLWAFLAVALLLNPFVPVRMHRADWQPIDLWLGVLLLGWSGYWAFRKPSNL